MKFREVPRRVKEHVKEHKELYIGISLGVGLAGITATIMREKQTLPGWGADESLARLGDANIASLSFGNRGIINITTVLDREGRGHPGWPVRNLESGRIFFSQRDAAQAFDISEGGLSNHINGKYPDVAGLHFERVNLAAA